MACAVETSGGSSFNTVIPPRMPCTITVPSAPHASHFIQRRRSANQVQIDIVTVSKPMNSAIMRWLCSYLMPPTMAGRRYIEPNEVGQSGTERPASLLVTSAPTTMSKNVAPAVKIANLWWARL